MLCLQVLLVVCGGRQDITFQIIAQADGKPLSLPKSIGRGHPVHIEILSTNRVALSVSCSKVQPADRGCSWTFGYHEFSSLEANPHSDLKPSKLRAVQCTLYAWQAICDDGVQSWR